jgi:hypothetical protein
MGAGWIGTSCALLGHNRIGAAAGDGRRAMTSFVPSKTRMIVTFCGLILLCTFGALVKPDLLGMVAAGVFAVMGIYGIAADWSLRVEVGDDFVRVRHRGRWHTFSNAFEISDRALPVPVQVSRADRQLTLREGRWTVTIPLWPFGPKGSETIRAEVRRVMESGR